MFSYSISYALKFIGDPLQAGRLVSSISGMAGAIGLYILVRRLYGNTVACITALFYILSPFTFFYHRMAMRESLLLANGVFVMLFSVFLVLGEDRKKNKLYVLGLSISLLLALLTKQHAGLFAVFPLASLLLSNKRTAFGKFIHISVAFLLTAIAFALVLATQENATRMISFAAQMLTTAPPTGLNGEIIVSSIYKYMGLVFLLLAAASLVVFYREKKFFEISIFIYPIFLLAALMIPPWLDTRYVLTAILPWYLFAGSVISLLIKNINTIAGKKRVWLIIAISALFLPSGHFIANYVVDPASTPFTRYDRGFLESGNSSYGVIESLTYLKKISDNSPILMVTEPGSGPKNWPFLFFENDSQVKVASWPGFRTAELAPYISQTAYVMLDDDPKTGGHFYFKKVNPNAKLIKRFWRPGKKTYVDLVAVEPKAVSNDK